ncbi:MAG: arsenate reductase ArsC [Pyrinomonadaceae bacterium]|nr:arsenate reductase ArsC [Phycisphaerales bacterium]
MQIPPRTASSPDQASVYCRPDEEVAPHSSIAPNIGFAVPNGTQRPKILFLCTGNSCRSHMAEGWAKALKPEVIEAYSAGTSPQGMNQIAIRVMAEVGVDISGHSSKRPQALGIGFDYVVTVCDAANESCPVFPARTHMIHVGFDDPPRLARNAKSDDEALCHYRRVRDEIKAFIQTLPESLTTR